MRKGAKIIKAKKIVAVLLTGTVAMGLLAGCGSDTKDNQGGTEQTAQGAAETSEETINDTSEVEASDNKEAPTSESGKLLQEMAGTGNWKVGECFRGSVSKEDVSEWIDSL